MSKAEKVDVFKKCDTSDIGKISPRLSRDIMILEEIEKQRQDSEDKEGLLYVIQYCKDLNQMVRLRERFPLWDANIYTTAKNINLEKAIDQLKKEVHRLREENDTRIMDRQFEKVLTGETLEAAGWLVKYWENLKQRMED